MNVWYCQAHEMLSDGNHDCPAALLGWMEGMSCDLVEMRLTPKDAGRWLAFDIGCIECGEPSAVVGIFATKEEAEIAAEEAAERQQADWHGQHYFGVFDLEASRLAEAQP